MADMYNNRIRRILRDGTTSTIAGSHAGLVDGVGTAVKLNSPWGIALDHGTGTLFVADHGNHRIRKVTLADGAVSTVCGSSRGFADGDSAAARFNGRNAHCCRLQ